MIKVIVGNNVDRKPVLINENSTLRSLLEEQGVDYTRGSMHLDGSTLDAGSLDRTFRDFGFDGTENHNKCYLLNVVKADNAT